MELICYIIAIVLSIIAIFLIRYQERISVSDFMEEYNAHVYMKNLAILIDEYDRLLEKPKPENKKNITNTANHGTKWNQFTDFVKTITDGKLDFSLLSFEYESVEDEE